MADYRRFGDYVLLEKEFESSLLSSWRAGEIKGNRINDHIRIDVLAPDLCKNASLAEHWLGHTVTASKLDHSNVLKEKTAIFDGALAAIYPFQESYCLEQLFKKSVSEGIPFSVDHALLIAGKLASGLSYASKTHQPHALVLPAFINVSAEGDLKMRGFAISHSLREHLSAHPELIDSYARYFPQGEHMGDGGLERYSVFAVGVLLFEMLTGEAFYMPGKVTDARMRISEAETASTDGLIPKGINELLCRAIDPNLPNSFESTMTLNSNMEQLLFSGEYSPTTFNLAFFMHSAFREEVEKRNAAMAAEKAHVFEDEQSAPAPPPIAAQKPAPGVSAPGTQAPPAPVVSSTAAPAAKSNMPLILGSVAGVFAIIIAAVYFIFIRGGGDEAEVKRLAQHQTLLESQQASKKATESLQDNRKDIEIQVLRDKLKQQMLEMQAENTRLDDEMKTAETLVDERDAELSKKIEEERLANEVKLAEMQAELDRVQKERDEELRLEEEAKEQARLLVEAEQKAKEEAAKVEQEAVADLPGYSVPVPVTDTAGKTAVTHTGSVLPHTMMDNAEQLEKPLNGRNFYTPSRKALTAGILTSGQYYAYSFNVVIDETGQTVECLIDQNPLDNLEDDFGMAKRATDWAKRLKYTPPKKDELPSKCKKMVLIHFRVL